MDPVARARAIAARLAATAIPNDALGKRKSRWEVRVVPPYLCGYVTLCAPGKIMCHMRYGAGSCVLFAVVYMDSLM